MLLYWIMTQDGQTDVPHFKSPNEVGGEQKQII